VVMVVVVVDAVVRSLCLWQLLQCLEGLHKKASPAPCSFLPHGRSLGTARSIPWPAKQARGKQGSSRDAVGQELQAPSKQTLRQHQGAQQESHWHPQQHLLHAV